MLSYYSELKSNLQCILVLGRKTEVEENKGEANKGCIGDVIFAF